MANTENTTNLQINVLSKEQYDSLTTKNLNEIYVVKEDLNDTDFSVSSRTYADVGRNAVIISNEEPSVEKSKIWINPDGDMAAISPADTDLNNITRAAKTKISSLIVPDYNSGETIDEITGQTFVAPMNGFIYVRVSNGGIIRIKPSESSPVIILELWAGESQSYTTTMMIGKNDSVYIDERSSGTVQLSFYPFKGEVNE